MLVPDLLGGSGSLGQPAFFANYNLAEVTGYIGILPLVAAAALLGRLRLRPRLPEWAIWHVMALVGFVLALGGNTPAGSLLVHLPLFGGLRLQSRNILRRGPGARRPFRLLGRPAAQRQEPAVPPGARRPPGGPGDGPRPAAGARHDRRRRARPHLGHGPPPLAAGGPGRRRRRRPLRPWLVPYALIGAGAIAFVVFGRRLPPRPRSRWLGGLIAIDLVVFTILGVVAVPALGGGPDPGRGANAAVGRGGQAAAAPPVAIPAPRRRRRARGPSRRWDSRDVSRSTTPTRSPRTSCRSSARPISTRPAPHRRSRATRPSFNGFYAAATGAHQAMGQGQDVLAPRAVGDGTLDQLNTSALLTPSAYLITRVGPAAAAGPGPVAAPAGTGHRDIAPNHKATWYFATPLRVSRLEVPDSDARQDAAAGTQIGLMTAGGQTRWFAASAPSASRLAISLPRPVTGVAVVAQAGGRPSHLGPLSITDTDGNVFVANGQLQDALVPPRWGYAGHDGSFAVFVNHLARGPLSLEALPGRPAGGASVRLAGGSAANPAAAAVFSPHGIRVIRSVTAIAGWSATWHPRHGPPVTLAVARAGLVQAVDVPPGRGVVTWRYQPPGFPAGFALSLAAALIIVLLTGYAAYERRPGRPGRQTAAATGQRGRAAAGQGGSMVGTDGQGGG